MPILKQFAPQSVSIPNATAQNLELSVEALGALTRLCSYSDNFEFKAEWLQTSWQMGRDRLRNILRELRNAGYLKFVASRNEANTGFEGQEWHLSTSPVFLKSSPPENPSPLDFSETENTEDNKKEEINKKKENKKKTENSDTDGNRPIAAMTLKPRSDFQCLMDYHANRIGTILDGGAQGKAIKKLLDGQTLISFNLRRRRILGLIIKTKNSQRWVMMHMRLSVKRVGTLLVCCIR